MVVHGAGVLDGGGRGMAMNDDPEIMVCLYRSWLVMANAGVWTFTDTVRSSSLIVTQVNA
jgi:hypothetical protein